MAGVVVTLKGRSGEGVRRHETTTDAQLRHGVDDDRPGQVVLEAAAPAVPQHDEEPGEQRDRGEHETDDAHERAPWSQARRAVAAHDADAHEARTGRLTR